MKLLIVDDEFRTRELLRSYLPWEEIGISELETARNGQLALACAIEWHPDIILCDVRMPKLNGIEFVSQYREINPDCKVIFLSGFSDKQYLKSAIHLKALTYIEKPVNLDEVRAAVESAVGLRRKDMEKRTEELKLQADVDRSLPFLRQEMIRRLIVNPTSPHVVPALHNQETFLLPLIGPYTVAVANLNGYTSNQYEDSSSVQEWILGVINGCSLLLALKVLAGFDSRYQLVLIFPGAYGSSYREGRGIIEDAACELRRLVGPAVELRLGIGEPASSLLAIPAAYQTASQASALQYYGNGVQPVFADSLGGHQSIEMNGEEVRRIRDQLRKGEVEEAKLTIRRWTAYARSCKDLDILRLRDTYFQFLLAIVEMAVQLGIVEQSEDTERRYMWKDIDRMPSLDALEEYVIALLDSFMPGSEGGDASNLVKMREITRYIYTHFHEKGFTIKSIADHVHLSETYLCAYFKKQRGQTIKEFITEVRMIKAKELLRDMNMKLFEVAVRLGFTDANYFTTFFKRYEGCTPSDYRERIVR